MTDTNGCSSPDATVWNYPVVRAKLSPAIYLAGIPALIVLAIFYRPGVLWFFGLVAAGVIAEWVLVKCPRCGHRPGRLLFRFPNQYRHCSLVFAEEFLSKNKH